MGLGRIVERGALCALALLSAASASAEPREPLIVTKLADPDPNYVGGSEVGPGRFRQSEVAADSKIEDAMQSIGRAIGEATIVQQQQIEALCRAGEPTNARPEQRFAYEASCRYSRH